MQVCRHQNWTEESPAGHTFKSFFLYAQAIMRGAFVVQLGPETNTAEGRLEGWVEEVDSCTELRFRSTQELLKFLGERFDLAMASAGKARADKGTAQVRLVKKGSRKEKR